MLHSQHWCIQSQLNEKDDAKIERGERGYKEDDSWDGIAADLTMSLQILQMVDDRGLAAVHGSKVRY